VAARTADRRPARTPARPGVLPYVSVPPPTGRVAPATRGVASVALQPHSAGTSPRALSPVDRCLMPLVGVCCHSGDVRRPRQGTRRERAGDPGTTLSATHAWGPVPVPWTPPGVAPHHSDTSMAASRHAGGERRFLLPRPGAWEQEHMPSSTPQTVHGGRVLQRFLCAAVCCEILYRITPPPTPPDAPRLPPAAPAER
jgi:hypothetical protein